MSATANYTPIDDLIKRYKKEQLNHVVSVSKEFEPPLARQTETMGELEQVEMVGVDEAVKPYVQVPTDKIQLDPELKKAGVQQVPQNNIPPYLNIQLPISDEKILRGLHQPPSSSLRWLSALAMYLLAKVHIQLKTVKGHVIRVLKR